MKTIPALILILLIACSTYGQNDSTSSTVTIPITTANLIEKELRDCDLVKLQLLDLKEVRQQQLIKIEALQIQKQQINRKFLAADTYASKLEVKLKQNKRKATWLKVSIGAASLVGFWLGSQ